MKKTSALAAVVLVAATASYAQEAQDRDANQPAQTNQRQTQREGQQGQISQWEQSFLKDQATCHNFGIQISQYVSQQVQDQQVKQLAQKIIQGHQKGLEQLKQAAQQAGVQVNDNLSPMFQAKLDHAKQKQGDQLKMGYLFHQYGGHHTALVEYKFMSQNAQNQAVKQYASQALPSIQQNLQQIAQLVGGEARTVTGEIGGQPAQQKQNGTSTTDPQGQTGSQPEKQPDSTRGQAGNEPK